MAGFYPQIDPRALVVLTTVKQMIEQDPAYLLDTNCPYDPEVIEQLQTLMNPKVVEVEVEVPKIVEKIVEKVVEVGGGKRGPKPKDDTNNIDVISAELQQIMTDLRQLKLNSKDLKPADKIQVIKTQAALIEKMISMEERATNIKKVSMFMSTVLGIMDDIMDDSQRQLVMKRLEPFVRSE